MAIETPIPVDPLPEPYPQRGDRNTFSDRVDNLVQWWEDSPEQVNAIALNVNHNATEALNSATASAGSATASAGSATAAAGSATAAAGSATAAAGSASAAATSATNAATSESNAAASAAAAAALAAAFTGTSSTSVSIPGAVPASRTFTTQTSEQYSAGITVSIVSQANIANFMVGQVTSYNSGTGQLVVNVTATGGSGTFADWNISLAGVQGPTGPQGPAGNLNGGNLLGALNELKAANIAAAATTDVWSITGNSATLTGTTTITSLGTAPQAGSKRTLIAAAATPLTNGANLILPGSANYTCAVGDRLEIYAETTTQHRVSIFKADGTPVVSSGINAVGATITGNTTLTASSAGYQYTQMAGMGRSVTLPAANTLGLGGPRFQVDNSTGQYPVGLRDNTGLLVGVVGIGGNALLSVKDNSTAAGVWGITGEGLEPGMVTIEADLSSSFDTTEIYAPFVALDDNVSIHFAKIVGTGFAAFVVDHTGKVVTAPVSVDTNANSVPVQAFKISATQAIVFYGTASNSHSAVVLSLTGSSPSYGLTVNTPANITTAYAALWGGEDFRADPKIAQLASNLYLFGTVSGANVVARAIGVSGTTVTIGAESASVGASGNGQRVTTYPLTGTTGLLVLKHGNAAPFTISAVVISVSGTTSTPGTLQSLSLTSSVNTAPSSVQLSATKVLVGDDNNSASVFRVTTATISGTAVTAGTGNTLDTNAAAAAYTSNNAGRYNPRLWRAGANSAGYWNVLASGGGGTRVIGLTESGGTITAGTIQDSMIAAPSAAGQMLPQGTAGFLGLKQIGATSPGGGMQLVSGSVSGTIVAKGFSRSVRDAFVDVPANFLMARNANGDVLVMAKGTTDTMGPSEAVVARQAANQPVIRGKVAIPEMTNPFTGTPFPVPNVAPNRFVAVGAAVGRVNTGLRVKVFSLELAA